METLTAVFQVLLDLSLTALPVMAAVLLARLALRSAPRKYSYSLWAVAGFRLLCPLSFPSPVSLFNSVPVSAARTAAQTNLRHWGQTVPALPYIPPAAQAAVSAAGGGTETSVTGAAGALSPAAHSGPAAMEILAVIWAAGLAAMLVWGLISWLRVRRSVGQGVLLEKGVYQCDGLKTPFVLGLFRPKIYVPFRMEEYELVHVLLHERTHLRRLDPWWKLLAFGLLSVYWWNPAVWLCFFLFCRDMEMSCDEAVLRRMGPEAKQSYSLSLVRFASGESFPAAGPLAFGENGAKSRVKNILRWKRAAPAAAFLAAALCLLAAVICGTDASTGRGWVQSEGAASAGGRTELRFSYAVPKDINSCLFYTDIYDGGELVSQNMTVCFDFNGAVNHAERRGTSALSGFINNDFKTGGWYFSMNNTDGDQFGATYFFSLPQRRYEGYSGPSFPSDDARGVRLALNELDAVAVLNLSDNDGKITTSSLSYQDAALPNPAGVTAVLRVQFSRLSAEEFEREFQKNGPGAGAAQDGNQVVLKNASDTATGSEGVAFTAELVKPVRSWAIYEDVYDHGTLISSIPRISDGFSEDGTGVTPRNFSGTLLCRLTQAGKGWNGAPNFSFGTTGSPSTAEWKVSLPSEHYNGSATISGGKAEGGKSVVSLSDIHEAALVTYVFSEKEPDATLSSAKADNIAKSSDAAVQFRLVTSAEPPKNSPGRGALGLYALKNPYVGDAMADGKLLKALGVLELGEYQIELTTSERPYVLQVNFQSEPASPGALNRAMESRAALLLALIGNLDEVRWTYRQNLNQEPNLIAARFDEANASAFTGGTPIKDCGASSAALQNLLNRLPADDAVSAGSGAGDDRVPFTNILGYDGYIRREPGASGFSISHYIARKDGREFCVAESWGWERSDHAVDLDGDGVNELVCNVTYGADGANRTLIYRLAADGSVEQANPLELLDVPHEDWGVGSLSETYDAGRGTVDISYIPKGTEDWQTKSYLPRMEKLSFLPFTPSETS